MVIDGNVLEPINPFIGCHIPLPQPPSHLSHSFSSVFVSV